MSPNDEPCNFVPSGEHMMRDNKLHLSPIAPVAAVLVVAGMAGCPSAAPPDQEVPLAGRKFVSVVAPRPERKTAPESDEPLAAGQASSEQQDAFPGTDVMTVKLNETLAVLAAAGGEDPPADVVVDAAIRQGMEALFMSNLVILPTAGVPEAEGSYFETFTPMAEGFVDALSRYLDGYEIFPCDLDGDRDVDEDDLNAFRECRTGPAIPVGPTCAATDFDGDGDNDQADFAVLQRHLGRTQPAAGPGASAVAARNLVQVFLESSQVIAGNTSTCDPLSDLSGPECAALTSDDEGGAIVDQVIGGFARQVRSPFFAASPGQHIQEQVIVPGEIEDGECAVVLKEIQGVKVIVRPVLLPIWVEPWLARATIVGFQTVWVWEFVPAEFLKTISFCNEAGSITQTVEIKTVIERELLSFWSFPRKEFTTTGE